MAKIGDLFVKLGLKNDEFKKGISEAKSETEGFGSKVKNMSAMAKAAWAAVGVAVVKFAKDFIGYTQKLGDAWTIQMEGVKGAYGAFVRQLTSGEGWDNLFANMAEAARVAREVAASMDELFERKVSYGYQEAETQKAISELQLIMRDASKSDEDRMAAAQKIIDMTKELSVVKKDIAEQEAKAQRDLFMSQTGLNAQETEFLLKNYNINRDIINQARDYYTERMKWEEQISAAMSSSSSFSGGDFAGGASKASIVQQAEQEIAALDAQTSKAIKDVSLLVQKYDLSNDALVEGLSQAEIALINVETEANRAMMRPTAMYGSLSDAQNRESGSAADKAAEEADKVLKRAQDAAKDELQLLSEKYEAEKALLERYGKDTEALTAEYIANLLGMTKDSIEDELSEIEDIEPVKIEPIEIDSSELDVFVEKLNKQMKLAEDITNSFNNAVVAGFSNGCQELMNQLMGLTEANPAAVFKALLDPLADMAIKAGEIIMAEGIATMAARSALLTFGVTGLGAVLAGAALVAVGSAAKAGLSALASHGATSAGAGSVSSASSSSATTQNVESSMTIYVTGRISGSDILISGSKTQEAWSR